MRLFNFIMFCMILAGCNLLVTVFTVVFTYGPTIQTITMNKFASDDHPFLLMTILAIDMIAFAIFMLNTVPNKDK